jgi:hypothetical protein
MIFNLLAGGLRASDCFGLDCKIYEVTSWRTFSCSTQHLVRMSAACFGLSSTSSVTS